MLEVNNKAAETSQSDTQKDLPEFELTLQEFLSGRVQSRRRRSSLVHRLSGGRRHTGRRFSLTKAEAALLSALDKKEEEKEKKTEEEEGATEGCTAKSRATETATASSSSPEESARPHRGRVAQSRLRNSIACRRSSLTPAESEFLERLADAEGVEDAAILSSAKVLETDELYKPNEPKKEDAGEVDEEGATKIYTSESATTLTPSASKDNGMPHRVVRNRPRGSIASRRTSLTPAELKFLERLGDDDKENEEDDLTTKACPVAESAAAKVPSSPSEEDDVRPISSHHGGQGATRSEGATRGCSFESTEMETVASSSSLEESAAGSRRGRGVARSRLRRSIVSHRALLSPNESMFLEQLADAEGVDDAAIISSVIVLETDELFNPGKPEAGLSAHSRDDQGEEDKISPQRDTALQAELWRPRPVASFRSSKEVKKEKAPTSDDMQHRDGHANADEQFIKLPPWTQQQRQESFMKQTQESFLSYVATLVGSCTAEQEGTLDWVSESDDDDDDDDSLDSEPRERLSTIPFQILGTSADLESDSSHSYVLSPPLMDTLRLHMPYAIQEDNFWLKYSLAQDGASLDTLLYKVRSSTHTILAIETVHGEVLGSFTSSPWRRRGDSTYYGSGEAFLWRMRRPRSTPCGSTEDRVELESDVETFPWTGENRNVQLFEPGRLIVGWGESDKGIEEQVVAANRTEDGREEKKEGKEKKGFGLTLNDDLSVGTSEECVTFGSPRLSKLTDVSFDVLNVEVWTLTPMADIENAVKLELSRQFVHPSIMESQIDKHLNVSRAM